MNANLQAILMRAVLREAPRRLLLRALSGVGLASLATTLNAQHDSAAKKRKRKKKCKGGTKKCGKTCILKTECCGGCADGLECCDGTCRDLATDGANCGACGTACDTNGCVNGFCTCQGPQDCNGCICALRLEDGETACSGDLTAQSCSVDTDCPARSFCRDTAGGGFCSEPCPA